MAWNTHIPKFRRFVLQNFPFIEEDFDALTDYELICKVVEYLNNVIQSQNGVIAEVETFETNITSDFNRLESLFVQLKSYVDNYFDNLDVQEEINNKLDDMAESGELEELIGVYLHTTAVWGFDNVAGMKNSTNLIDGSYAQTLGYYAKNDNGAGLYKIRSITESDVVDEARLIALTDTSLVAELVVNDHITPEQFGCYGDGTHDDTTNLQKAINTGYNIKACKIYNITNVSMANITFDLFGTINGHVSLGKYVTLKGGNINGTTDAAVITVENDNDSIRSMETYIENVKITPTADGIGIYIDATEHSMFNTFIRDCEIVSGSIGIKFENANSHWITQTLLENVYLHSPTTGLKFINTGTIIAMTDIVLKDVYAQFYNHKPVNFIDADLVRLDLYNCKCYDGIEDAIYKVTNSNSLLYVNNSVLMSENLFSSETDPKILRYNSLANSDGGSVLRVNKGVQYLPTITNGQINPAASGTTGIALSGSQFLGFVGKIGSNISSSGKYSALGFQNGRLSCGYSDTTTLGDFKTVEVTTPYSGGVYTTATLPTGSDVRNGATCWCSDIHMAVTRYSNKWYKPDGTELTV